MKSARTNPFSDRPTTCRFPRERTQLAATAPRVIDASQAMVFRASEPNLPDVHRAGLTLRLGAFDADEPDLQAERKPSTRQDVTEFKQRLPSVERTQSREPRRAINGRRERGFSARANPIPRATARRIQRVGCGGEDAGGGDLVDWRGGFRANQPNGSRTARRPASRKSLGDEFQRIDSLRRPSDSETTATWTGGANQVHFLWGSCHRIRGGVVE
jgi:hypothetical protein